jgi:hypothetical protein
MRAIRAKREDETKHELAKSLADEALNKLAAAIKQGHSEALSTYLTIMGRFYRYSWRNALLIATQRPEATRVAGFHTRRKLSRGVRKRRERHHDPGFPSCEETPRDRRR